MSKGSVGRIGFLVGEEENPNSGTVRPFVNWALVAASTGLGVHVFLHKVGRRIGERFGGLAEGQGLVVHASDSSTVLSRNVAESGCSLIVTDDHYRRLRLLSHIQKERRIRSAVYVQLLNGRHSISRYVPPTSLPLALALTSAVPFKVVTYEYLNRMRSASVLIASSRLVATLMRWLYGLDAHAVVYPPVDTGVFRPRAPDGGRASVLLFTGSRYADTRRQFLGSILRAVRALGFPIDVIGEAPLAAVGRGNAELRLLGRVDDDDQLATFYSQAVMTIAPQAAEGFGYVPVESMACGTPVIALDSPAIAEASQTSANAQNALSEEDLLMKLRAFTSTGATSEVHEDCRAWATENYAKERSFQALLAALPPRLS